MICLISLRLGFIDVAGQEFNKLLITIVLPATRRD